VVGVGQLGGERRGRVVVVVESVRHVVRRPGSTLTLTGRVRAGGGARLCRRVLWLLVMMIMLVVLVLVLVVLVLVVLVLVTGLETAVVGRVVEGPGSSQLGRDVEISQVEGPGSLGRQRGGGRVLTEVGGAH